MIALALGISVNATVFTFVNAVLIRGLSFDDPDRIMSIGTRDGRDRDRRLPYLDFEDWRAARSFPSLAVFNGATMIVSDKGRSPEQFGGPYISANAFKMIGQKPMLGATSCPRTTDPAPRRWFSSATASGKTVTALLVEGRPESAGQQSPTVTLVSIGPRYFETIGVQLGRGRTFDGLDGSTGHEAAMDQQLARPRWAFRLFGPMFAIFAVIALALSSVGLYAVMAYSVAQRTQEIGVRMAFGAQATLVLWLILRQSLVQLAVGIGGACGGGRLLDSVLVQSGSRELVTLTSIVALLVVVSLAACVWPARQATRMDPVSVPRND